jgi:hypothetical protein
LVLVELEVVETMLMEVREEIVVLILVGLVVHLMLKRLVVVLVLVT